MFYARCWRSFTQETPNKVEQFTEEKDAKDKAFEWTRKEYSFADVVVRDFGSPEASLKCLYAVERSETK